MLSQGKKKSIGGDSASLKFKKNVISVANNISFDAACSLLFSSKDILKDSFKSDAHVSSTFCPKCSSPWIAGYYTSRLISFPRNSKIVRKLIRKEKSNRISKEKLLLLSAYRRNCNIHKVTCKLCHYSDIKEFKLPSNNETFIQTEKSKTFQENEVALKPRKKKKRKPKDKNAGLRLDGNINVTEVTSNLKKDKPVVLTNENICPVSHSNLLIKERGCKLSNNSMESDTEQSVASSDSDDEIIKNPRTSLAKKVNEPQKKNTNLHRQKILSLSSFNQSAKERGKKISPSQIKLNEKNKKKIKEIFSSSIAVKQKPTDLASFLNSIF